MGIFFVCNVLVRILIELADAPKFLAVRFVEPGLRLVAKRVGIVDDFLTGRTEKLHCITPFFRISLPTLYKKFR